MKRKIGFWGCAGLVGLIVATLVSAASAQLKPAIIVVDAQLPAHPQAIPRAPLPTEKTCTPPGTNQTCPPTASTCRQVQSCCTPAPGASPICRTFMTSTPATCQAGYYGANCLKCPVCTSPKVCNQGIGGTGLCN